MKKEKNDALEVQDPPEEALSLMGAMPDYLATQEGPVLGAENVEKEDFILPRLLLCSKQTPQFDENNELHIEGLKQGDFFNSITREVHGSEIYVVPLFEVKTRAKMRPYGESGPPTCRSFDGKVGEGDPGGECKTCPHRQFTQSNGKSFAPACTEFLNFTTVIMPDKAKPAQVWKASPRVDTLNMIGFKRTSIQNGQQWITLLKLRARDWFAGVYKLTSVAKSDGKNSWYVPVIENAGWLNKDGYDVCRPFYEGLKELFDSGRFKVEVDAEQEREPGAEG